MHRDFTNYFKSMNHFDSFISYSNKDFETISLVVDIIQEKHVNCWFQKQNSKADYIKEINKGIKESNNFIIFLSPSSLSSIRVKNEINRAIQKYNKDKSFSILPVVISELKEEEEEEAMLLLGSFNWLYSKDFPDYDSLVLKIISSLHIKTERGSKQSIYSGDEESEINRINLQNEYLNKIASKYLDKIFKDHKNPRILDVGCADGRNIIERIKGRNYQSLLGIDKNQQKIDMANEHLITDKNTFDCCDISSDSLYTTISSYLNKHGYEGFDIIHIAAVLMHIKNPKELLERLHQYLSPGGTIFIQDEDDGANMVYPYDKSFDDCFYVWAHSNEAGDRHMGRKVAFYLSACNYSDINVHSTCITSLDFNGAMKDRLWDMYFNSELWVANNPSYFDSNEAYERYLNYSKKQPKLREEYMKGNYFVILGVIFISAKK